jgi:CBS domain-containing protein
MASVREILSRKDSVTEAARLMNEHGIGGLVVREGDTVVGMFTERDILRRVVAAELDPAQVDVGTVMTTPVMSVRPDARLEECAALVTEKRIRHIPVMDGASLVGIVTSGDILAFQVQEQRDTIKYLNSYVYDVR